MGMYTQLTLVAELKTTTPQHVIETLKFMAGVVSEPPKEYPFPDGRYAFLLNGGSAYFPDSAPARFIECMSTGSLTIDARTSIKNYGNEIETFLEWVKPYIGYGSGSRDLYASVLYEEDAEPTNYFLDNGEY